MNTEKNLFKSIPNFLNRIQLNKKTHPEQLTGFIHIMTDNKMDKKKLVKSLALGWQKDHLLKVDKEVTHFNSELGPVWILQRKEVKSSSNHFGLLDDSNYAWYREQVGSLFGFFRAYQLKQVSINFYGSNAVAEKASLLGLGLSAYNYFSVIEGAQENDWPLVYVNKERGSFKKEILDDALGTSQCINAARHLTNMPPNLLNPDSYSEIVKATFAKIKNVKIDIWDDKRLQKEGMGLHLAVGQGALNPPCLVHIQYRPKTKAKKIKKPIALVGKGITFDTGGLDIKPSSAMRLMKKDMGGSAAVFGTMLWAVHAEIDQPLDAYLALAENAISDRAMRPSDVYQARNGLKVEIHNTDAEGRLVLADALDVAVTQKDEPKFVINVATLTGAIKVALGAEVAGLFSNDDTLALELSRAGIEMGELNWRMPLLQRMNGSMASPFSNMVNATDGFGGAITAALFLEKFVRGKAWAHMDIYGWNDKPSGSLSFAGGNGQAVQTLIGFLQKTK